MKFNFMFDYTKALRLFFLGHEAPKQCFFLGTFNPRLSQIRNPSRNLFFIDCNCLAQPANHHQGLLKESSHLLSVPRSPSGQPGLHHSLDRLINSLDIMHYI